MGNTGLSIMHVCIHIGVTAWYGFAFDDKYHYGIMHSGLKVTCPAGSDMFVFFVIGCCFGNYYLCFSNEGEACMYGHTLSAFHTLNFLLKHNLNF